jgi:murein DD-endopeptidase MepM/ murein hydrolase activator NlpD
MYGGEVVYSDKANGYGNYVSILMNEGPYKGEKMGYGHMNAPSALEVGQTIQNGYIIGAVGNTGTSTGPHVHIEVGDNVFNKRQGENINHLFIGKYKQRYEPN